MQQFAFAIQPMLHAASEAYAAPVLRAWGAYAGAVLAGHTLVADGEPEYVDYDEDDKHVLGRLWVTCNTEQAQAAYKAFAALSDATVFVSFTKFNLSAVAYDVLHSLCKHYGVEGYRDLNRAPNGEIDGVLYLTDERMFDKAMQALDAACSITL